MEYHPDRNHGFQKEAEEKMKAINSAWDYIRDHFSEYQNMNASKTDWNSGNSNKDTKSNNTDTQTNWAGFKIVVTITWLLTWWSAQSPNNSQFYDIWAFFHDHFDWFVIRIVLNPYILSVGLLLWACWSLAKNKTWKRIVIWLLILNLLITTYKVEKLSEADDFRYRPTQQSIDAYKKYSNTGITVITDPDLLLKKLSPVITKVNDGSYNFQWNKIEWAKKYEVFFRNESRGEIADKKCEEESKLSTDNTAYMVCLFDEELKAEKQEKPIFMGDRYRYKWPDNSTSINNFELNQKYSLFIIVDYWNEKSIRSSGTIFYTK